MANHFDTIVIGVGAMGAATCFELAKKGQRVLGIEQFDIPHNFGSSHGHTRIIRKAYFEGATYVPLLQRSFELWEEIENYSKRKLFIKTGSLDIGLPESQVFSGSVSSCKEHHLTHEVYTAKEVNNRFPGYNLPEHFMANYQPDGGFLIPEQCIIAFVEAAQKRGAEIKAQTKVLDWKIKDGIVKVQTSRGEYLADRLVITAGAWNAKILPMLERLCVPERQVLGWFQTANDYNFSPKQFPVFVLEVGDDNFYGFPIHDIPGFKFGKYRHQREVVDPDHMDRKPNAKDEEVLRTFANQFFPQGNGATMALKTCMFTNTPDSHFIIDKHSEYPKVTFAAGFSGHGFKFSSVMGEIMSDLSATGTCTHDIEMFRFDRF